jgi:1,4-dihydroxy-2-naphthoate polyprenyltransferase
MEKENSLKVWLAQTRANFLLLAVVLVLIGLALAFEEHKINATAMNILDCFLLIIGVVLTHTSVNLFNEYSDFKTKIDFNTTRNPFSGGSGMLTSGKTTAGSVLFAAILTLFFSGVIGVYFIIKAHWMILVIIAFGGFAIIFYTNFLAKILLGELFAGFTLGTLVVVGVYFAMTATQHTPISDLFPIKLILISIPPGILTFLLLFLNEFPDADADKQGGRYHLVIMLGKRKSAILYNVLLIINFAVIIITPFLSNTPYWIYLALLPIPLAIKAGTSTMKFAESIEKITPVLGMNVGIVLLTDLFLAVGIFLEAIL